MKCHRDTFGKSVIILRPSYDFGCYIGIAALDTLRRLFAPPQKNIRI